MKENNTTASVLGRNLDLPHFKKIAVLSKEKVFSVRDSGVRRYIDLIGSLETPKSEDLTLEIVDDQPPFQFERKHDLILEPIFKILEILETIKSVQIGNIPNLIFSTFTSIYSVHSMASPGVITVFEHPIIFPFSLKRSILLMTGFDFPTAKRHYSYLKNGENPSKPQQYVSTVEITIRRSNLFEDGIVFLKWLGPGHLFPQVKFPDENGVGGALLKEFFHLLSKEFCKKSLGLWITQKTSSEFAWMNNGLFPNPNADKQLFYFLGILCAKALMTDSFVSVPFNRAFWKLVKGEDISVSEVDPQLGKSLSFPDDLEDLPFTFPGYDTIELVPNGKNIYVTKETGSKYVELVSFMLIGDNMKSIVNSFVDGMSTILIPSFLDLFSPDELHDLFTGRDSQISESDLKEHVQIQHGYNRNSPQIDMLFSSILGMTPDEQRLFVRFITGSDRLPVGGLGSLEPKLTVALRNSDDLEPDKCLPTVMACTSYLKIPRYSSKEQLDHQLKVAIYDGQESFFLS